MKKTGSLLIIIILNLIVQPVIFAQNDPSSQLTGKILFEIGPGENIVNDESCFLFSLNGDKTAMVTSVGSGRNKQFYNYYSDGRKEGPFRRPDSTIWLECRSTDESSGKYDPVFIDHGLYGNQGTGGPLYSIRNSLC